MGKRPRGKEAELGLERGLGAMVVGLGVREALLEETPAGSGPRC